MHFLFGASGFFMQSDLMLHHHHDTLPHSLEGSFNRAVNRTENLSIFQEHANLGCATPPQLPAFTSHHIRNLSLVPAEASSCGVGG
jgi:hypothetical protein